MARNQNTQTQEVAKMEQMEPQEYSVALKDGKTGKAIVDPAGEILLDNGSFTERHSFVGLVNRARRDSLPEWTNEIPGLTAKIQAVFTKEKEQGIDPFVRFANDGGRLTVTDLRAGTSLSAPIKDLKKTIRMGQPLPKAFSSKTARRLIDLAA